MTIEETKQRLRDEAAERDRVKATVRHLYGQANEVDDHLVRMQAAHDPIAQHYLKMLTAGKLVTEIVTKEDALRVREEWRRSIAALQSGALLDEDMDSAERWQGHLVFSESFVELAEAFGKFVQVCLESGA